jgi:radical SAM superfamily enzyme YgiQ (UPF0313 family)
MRAEQFILPRLGLEIFAAHTPMGHEVTIVDETFAPDDAGDPADIVGITATTHAAMRAYEIADLYRRKGAIVMMGGIHATVLPQEALAHADAVVVGEAEDAWEMVVRDAEHGRVRRIYRNDGPIDLAAYRALPGRKYPRRRRPLPFSTGIETSRGCAYDCDFCSVSSVMGNRHRVRVVDEVVRETTGLSARNIFFLDDALGQERGHAMQLFRALEPFCVRWIGQGIVSLARDREMLGAMRRSGCVGLLVGFESVQEEAAGEIAKLRRLGLSTDEIVRRFHDEGIAVIGSFIFGLDHETPDIFVRTYAFVARSRLDGANPSILIPYPGTRLYDRLAAEKRLLNPLWWREQYSSTRVLFRPLRMSPDQLLEGWLSFGDRFHSLASIARRLFGIVPQKRGFLGTVAFLTYNAAQRRFFRAVSAGGSRPVRRCEDHARDAA